MRKDCLGLHFNEKAKLKAYFKESKQMICLTTDMWTSGQKVDYLRFTSHFIDDDWKLRKEVLDFIPCSNHKGDELGQLLEKCLNEWGIDKILAMTTENLSSSDKTVGHLAQRIVTKGMTILGGQHLHIRCVAHIVDLAVMDVLSNFKSSIGRIRTVVRYIKRSPVRLKKFEDFVVEERIESHKSLHLDVPTKWNSVYLMLETAIIYQSAFERYETSDADFR